MSTRQASLEVPWPGGKGSSADTEDDSKSNHSWRSTSRISSRRQSTEESIDSDDEWYCYELKQLEELEKKTHFERVFGPTAVAPVAAGARPESSKADFREKMSKAVEDIRRQSVAADRSSHDDDAADDDTFEQQPLDTVVEEEPTCRPDDGPIRFKLMKVPPDTPSRNETDIEDDPNAMPEAIQPVTAVVGRTTEDGGGGEDDVDEDVSSPGTPSLPRFKFDKTDGLADDKDDTGGGGGVASKWKIVKALKEKKPEEINQDIGPPPTPIVEVTSLTSLTVPFWPSCVLRHPVVPCTRLCTLGTCD